MNNDIVLSSRVRLARNIDGYPFFLQDERAALITKTVSETLKKIDKFQLFRMIKLEDSMATALVERHLISPDLVKNKNAGAVVISDDEKISVMLSEEDHLRLQCILSSFSLDEAFERISRIDKTLSSELNFAFSNKYGYLTSCLTNLGTGMRASVMMFLPALTLSGSLEQCFAGITRLSMAVRGVYGEGSEASGFIYQISNQRTLGITEQEIIQSVKAAAMHIINSEIKAREFIFSSMPDEIKDRILRSYGTLTKCHKLSYKEFMNLISYVKLGVYYKMFTQKDTEEIGRLIIETGPANIGIKLLEDTPLERDKLRAEEVRRRLKSNIFFLDNN
jgi:protein arginine kinase